MLLAGLRRLANAVALIVAVVLLNFLLIHLAPGDPAVVLAGESGGTSPETLAAIRHAYGLDRPFLTQLLSYLGQVFRGDLGHSYYFDASVTSLIGQRLGPTLLLSVSAMLFALVLGTVLGVSAARRPNGAYGSGITVLSVVGFAMPAFWLGSLLVLLFGLRLGIFPTAGMESPIPQTGFFARMVDIGQHLVLPTVSLGLVYLALYSRTAKASMVDVLGSDYIRTARAKGVGPGIVTFKHAFRNALIPVVTVAGLQTGALLSGAVLVEIVFNWPGLGRLALDSILRRDTPVLLGILVVSSVVVIVANLLTDLTYRLIDPRIRTGVAR
ncbi:ABC transporter permease [Dactylosporangium fulvum]|uniref:ABC transporter permease n=1 Tax=Dactylosporangium fulvum TaxID=53359 RepID=A0ABY5W5T7_9ACTN|nr:ABC transporter permease [Dactylosporangium fulvum]UWP85368.1 ABC transporter permease [Dactylosporangium fulvum]